MGVVSMEEGKRYEFVVVRYYTAVGRGITDEMADATVNGREMKRSHAFHDVLNFFGNYGFYLVVGNTHRTVKPAVGSGQFGEQLTPATYVLQRQKNDSNEPLESLMTVITS